MITATQFGHLPNSEVVTQFCLCNRNGVKVEILDLGGIIRRWLVPNNTTETTDIVLGFDSVDEYLADDSYLGAIVGRYANRICHGKFSVNGVKHQATVNQNGHCLHGGPAGFNQQVWKSNIVENDGSWSLHLALFSPDGDQGFPADLQVRVIYTLTEQNRLKIEYSATSSQATVFNPTNHSYFNLCGHSGGSVDNHQLQIDASFYTPTNEQSIPTGEIASVNNTPFDLNNWTDVKSCLTSNHPQIQYGNGIDHNWCLDNYVPDASDAQFAGQARVKGSNLTLQVYTTMPGMQIFTANHFANKIGKNNTLYQAHQGFCFETQFYPNSPNQANFPSPIVGVEKAFYSVTEYAVGF